MNFTKIMKLFSDGKEHDSNEIHDKTKVPKSSIATALKELLYHKEIEITKHVNLEQDVGNRLKKYKILVK